MKDIIRDEFNQHLIVASSLESLVDDIAKSAELCINCLKNGGKILIFGNGGSAADAQHIAAELVGRYKANRKGLSAIALTTDTSAITSIANDFEFSNIFDRQVEALANEKDIVIGISTSGQSKNVISALKVAKQLDCITIGLSGNNGLLMNEVCDVNNLVKSNDTPRIQEIHILLGHTLCHLIDIAFNQ